jgi:hypothetical protein
MIYYVFTKVIINIIKKNKNLLFIKSPENGFLPEKYKRCQ